MADPERRDGHTSSVLVCSWRDRWHPDAGGAEVYLDHVVRDLAVHGWDVTVATAAYTGAAEDEVRDGVRYVRRGGTFTVYLRIALLALLGRLGRPDVIVDVQNGVPFWACAWSRRPVVVLHHHAHREQWRALFGDLVGRIGWFIESQVAPRVQRRARWVTVSAASRDDLVTTGVARDRITVVHNGTTSLDRGDVAPSPTPRVLVLGRLVPHKRVELAIDAVAEIAATLPDVSLDIVGDGEWQPDLVAHTRAAGVADRVVLHGHVDEETKRRLVAEAWVLALPSVKEGWGLVVVEAASLGVPTVAFAAAGGVRESIVDGVTGRLVDDQEAFVAAIRHLLTDADARATMGAAAIRHSSGFTWESTGQAFATVLEQSTQG